MSALSCPFHMEGNMHFIKLFVRCDSFSPSVITELSKFVGF